MFKKIDYEKRINNMKATELRIGNFISINFGNCDDGKTTIVEGISDCEIYNEEHGYSPCNEFKPILLTEQWLLDFGFEDEGGDDYVLTKGENALLLTVEKDSISVSLIYLYGTYNSEYIFLKDILYVHQLQNLYFALTQKELVLKKGVRNELQ